MKHFIKWHFFVWKTLNDSGHYLQRLEICCFLWSRRVNMEKVIVWHYSVTFGFEITLSNSLEKCWWKRNHQSPSSASSRLAFFTKTGQNEKLQIVTLWYHSVTPQIESSKSAQDIKIPAWPWVWSLWNPPPGTRWHTRIRWHTHATVALLSKIARGRADEGNKRGRYSVLNIEEGMMREGRGSAPLSLYLWTENHSRTQSCCCLPDIHPCPDRAR